MVAAVSEGDTASTNSAAADLTSGNATVLAVNSYTRNTAPLTVTKTFSGLSETQVAALANTFAIQVKDADGTSHSLTMGSGDHHPFRRRIPNGFFELEGDLDSLSLGRLSQVDDVSQNPGDGTRRPAVSGTGGGMGSAKSRRKDARPIELAGDVAGADAVRRPGKDAPYRVRRLLVRQQVILVRRVFPVAVGGEAADEAAAAALHREGTADFPAGVPGVHLVDYVFERHHEGAGGLPSRKGRAMADDVNENDLPLAEFVKLPTTVDFNTINSDRFKLFVRDKPYLKVGTELASGYAVVYTNEKYINDVFHELGDNYLSFFPKILSPLDEQSNYDSGITQILNQPYLDLTGRGVIIGFVDTGIDYTKSNFQNADGTSRILDIWDQTVEGPRSPDVYYGAVYTQEDINRALRSDKPFETVPSRDEDGHGTFLASVAAGGRNGEYVGAAPNASIIAVKLRRARPYYIRKFLLPEENPNLFEETDCLLGIKYVLDRSEELNVPVVLCIGLGSNMLFSHSGAPAACRTASSCP